jgi:hypothetical protein
MAARLQSDQFAIVADSCNHAVLQPNQACTIAAVFRPTSVGGKVGLLTVETTDVCGLVWATAQLSGSGLSPPDGGP